MNDKIVLVIVAVVAFVVGYFFGVEHEKSRHTLNIEIPGIHYQQR